MVKSILVFLCLLFPLECAFARSNISSLMGFGDKLGPIEKVEFYYLPDYLEQYGTDKFITSRMVELRGCLAITEDQADIKSIAAIFNETTFNKWDSSGKYGSVEYYTAFSIHLHFVDHSDVTVALSYKDNIYGENAPEHTALGNITYINPKGRSSSLDVSTKPTLTGKLLNWAFETGKVINNENNLNPSTCQRRD